MNKYIFSSWYVYDKHQKVNKRCPFCGGVATIGAFEELGEESSEFYYAGEEVRCLDCEASIREYNDDFSHKPIERIAMRERLKEKWNKRKGDK